MIVHENAPVAQGIEQRIPNPCAAGSNPARRTIKFQINPQPLQNPYTTGKNIRKAIKQMLNSINRLIRHLLNSTIWLFMTHQWLNNKENLLNH
jgi:hypothetical protein